MGASLGRLITDYRGLVETCRARADELAVSRLELDRLAGLAPGYSGKLLGNGKGKTQKTMWPVGLESVLGVLGLRILLIEDEAATARTLALRTPVDRTNQRPNNVSRLKPMLLPPPDEVAAAPAEAKPVLAIVRPKTGVTKYG